MTIAPERTAGAVADPQELVSPEVFDRLSSSLVRDEGVNEATAGRVMAQTLAFLRACALAPGERLTPSRQVDKGWHAFILHTREYAEFCERIGMFIDHVPDDAAGGPCADQAVRIAATVETMRAAGLPVDDGLWAGGSADCSQCHAGCHDSPRGA